MTELLSRLRLHIQRNGLPDTRIVFLPTTTENTTVMQLLEQVNELVPLESPDWGLDDYMVELPSTSSPSKNYECLHYQPITKLLDKDDEVIIRPLSSEDLKKRLIGGRHQISSDGKRLVDGVPFGRPLLKRPRGRPAVTIAPRKLPRPSGNGLLEFEEAEEEEEEDGDFAMQLIPYVSDDNEGEEHDSEEDDSDEEEEEDDEEMDLDADEIQMLREDALGLSANGASKDSTRTVHWHMPRDPTPTENSESSNESSDDDDFEDAGSDSSSESDSNVDPDDSSDSDGSDNEGPLEISTMNPNETPAPAAPPAKVLPNEGKARTKKRNARRRAKKAMDRARQLEASKERAVDDSTPTLAVSSGPSTNPSEEPVILPIGVEEVTTESPSFLGRHIHLDLITGKRFIASALGLKPMKQIVPKAPEVIAKEKVENKIEREAKLTAIKEARKSVVDQFLPPRDDPLHWASRIDYTAIECSDDQLVPPKPTFPFVQWFYGTNKGQERIKGFHPREKTTATKAGDKRKHDTDTAADEPKPKRQVAASPASTTSSSGSSSEDSSDNEDDSDYEDTTKAQEDGDSDEPSDDTSYHDSGSDEKEAEEQLKTTDNATAAHEEELPPLAADISSLPILDAGQAVEGMVVTWKNWVLSELTNWQPQVTDVTARVVGVEDDGKTLHVVLAPRDRDLDKKPEKRYDEETGERVYGRFDGPDMEDDDIVENADDDGHRTVVFAELMEPRIVKSA
ncbi:hypothetical protein SEUCBS140593_008818 [Sporothrix eucalyptigena]|uniref:DUF7357 domain-containing protein n=1 Tax=Sporothrix eucalyptigena TaxID=1812306 RepID=A0ABP0CPM5_9PEZI